jgi:hypothetical protein
MDRVQGGTDGLIMDIAIVGCLGGFTGSGEMIDMTTGLIRRSSAADIFRGYKPVVVVASAVSEHLRRQSFGRIGLGIFGVRSFNPFRSARETGRADRLPQHADPGIADSGSLGDK